MLINEFYANREIFVTGATGFLGKALIEKFLRDSPTIKVIYVLLRGKKSLSAQQRLEELKKSRVFDNIRQNCPDALNKLHAIQGDGFELGLGISPTDLKLLQNVSVIFHMAANVKFDNPLRHAILLNTRGTYELIKIAEGLKNLLSFVHCSTAYCNPFENIVEERVYKMPVNWQKTIKIAETYDEDTLNILFHKYTGFYPNSYTFTKNLSEQLIQEYSNKLPICIFRPSVVLNAYKEPIAGWTDNMNGPIAAMVGLSIGILPLMISSGKIKLDSVPVDMVTKLTIVAGYKRGISSLRKEPMANGFDVINCASGNIFHINLDGAMALYDNAVRKNPMENKIWHFDYPLQTSCYYNFILQILLINIPIAIILDTILRFKGRPTMMMKFSRRFVYGLKAVDFFTFREFHMVNKNMVDLEDYIPKKELTTYGFKEDFLNVDLEKYFENLVRGVKYYLFNQPPQATAAAIKRAKILIIANRTIKSFIVTSIILYIWSLISKF